MQVVVSTSLQTSRSRCMPWPAEEPEWPEIISACNALRSAIFRPHSVRMGAPTRLCLVGPRLNFLDLYHEPFEFRRKSVWIDDGRRQLIRQSLCRTVFVFHYAAESPVNGDSDLE